MASNTACSNSPKLLRPIFKNTLSLFVPQEDRNRRYGFKGCSFGFRKGAYGVGTTRRKRSPTPMRSMLWITGRSNKRKGATTAPLPFERYPASDDVDATVVRRRPSQFQQEILGLAVPTPEARVGETYTMVEAATHAMGEAVVAAVRDIISAIG
jgi:hypothetical protein